MARLPKWLLAVLALVALLSLTSPMQADEVKGKVKRIAADKNEFVITDSDGKDLEFVLAENSKILLNDKDGKLNDLKEGDEITITYEKKDGKSIVTEIRSKRE